MVLESYGTGTCRIFLWGLLLFRFSAGTPKRSSTVLLLHSRSAPNPCDPPCPAQFRKSVMSIKFPPVILGPEMAAPILWAPGIFGFFLLENPHAHKNSPFRGGGWVFLEGAGWKCQFYFSGAWGFFRHIGVFRALRAQNLRPKDPHPHLLFIALLFSERQGKSPPPPKKRIQGQNRYPQRTCVTKILPNFWVNFLVRFAQNPLFCWVVLSNCSENSSVCSCDFLVLVFFFGLLKDFFSAEALKFLGKRRENALKKQGIPWKGEKARKSQKARKRRRSGQSPECFGLWGCDLPAQPQTPRSTYSWRHSGVYWFLLISDLV